MIMRVWCHLVMLNFQGCLTFNNIFFCREELFLVMIMYFGAVISTIELICAGKMSYIVLKTKIGKLYLVLTN